MVREINFDGWGYREIDMAMDLLDLYRDGKMSKLARDYFDDREFPKVALNDQSGYVFLTNDDYQVLVENDGELDLFITTGWSGEEGTLDELVDNAEYLEKDDLEDLLQYREYMTEDQQKRIELSYKDEE